MSSLWIDTVELPRFGALEKDIKTDVLIIGGGLAGVLCAHMLHQAGVDYALVEADRIGRGITKNTTAKITSQHGLIYAKLERGMGLDAAKTYLEANQAALERYRELCRDIDCAFQEQDAFVYAMNDSYKLEREAEVLREIGFPADLVSQVPLPMTVAGALRFPKQAQFHPLKFVSGLVPGLRIYEDTKVLELAPGLAVTNRGKIRAEKIIVATHFPILNKHGSYFLKLYQHRSYVLALRGAGELDGMYIDEADKGLSFRSCGNLLLLGGGSHRTGKKGGNWWELSSFAQSAYPGATEVFRWATQDCMTLDGVPYIGQYSLSTPDLYVATGFNKWGMTGSMAAAMLLRDLVQGKDNPWAELFSPSRSMLHPQLALNALEATLSLLTPTAPRCPHMGCALKYNVAEHSWDCPCHGSRFTREGKLIDNPATDDVAEAALKAK